jgi:uncharacterized membrane protein YecN with MAPEG domain
VTEPAAFMPAVTMLYAGMLGILLVGLALNVVRLRLGKKVGLGVGEGGLLEQPVRVHANFTEYAPTFLVLLLVAELTGTAFAMLHTAGVVFVAARLLHAFGLSRARNRSFGRFTGSAGTMLSILGLSVYLVARSIG